MSGWETYHNFRDPVSNSLITEDLERYIARGSMSNLRSWAKLGFNGAVTTEAVLSPQGGVYSFLGTGTTMTVRSSSTNDSATGSGLRTLTLHYLDYNFAEKSTTLTLNGTNAVNSTATDVYRIQNMRAATAGATYKATGNITLTAGAGTYGYILAGYTRMRQAVWTVPAGKTLYILQCNISSITSAANKYSMTTIRANYDDKLGTRLTPGFMIAYGEIALESNVMSCHYDVPLVVPQMVDIMAVGTANASSVVSVAFRGYVEG